MRGKWGFLAAVVFAAMLCVSFSAFAATVTGVVNDEFQIVADDGKSYEVGLTPLGDEVLAYVGSRVKVEGDILQEEGKEIIEIVSYEVLELDAMQEKAGEMEMKDEQRPEENEAPAMEEGKEKS